MTPVRYRYPRTYHFHFSESLQNDDRKITSLNRFIGQEVVAPLKLDGESTAFYHDDYMHARSIDSPTNWTRNHAKKIHSVLRHELPEGWRLCCENVYAKHSIYYPPGYLEGYVYVLSVWNEKNECLSWDDTLTFAQLLDMPTPPVKYRGIFSEEKIKEVCKALDTSIEEGIVMRLSQGVIPYAEFSECFAKYVRKNHVATDEHWLKNAVPNGLPRQPQKPAFMSQMVKPKVK